MPQHDQSLDLITRYLNNPTSPSLQVEISSFRSASKENEAYFLEIEKIWKYAAEAAKLEEINAADSTKRFAKNLHQIIPKKSFAKVWFSGVAASLLILALGYWFYIDSNTPNYLVKTTSSNQIDSVKLADGSVVILAQNSELKYPAEFKRETREVILTKGQAFFKVAKNIHHPFKVTMDKSDVTVLGTSFNIRLTDSSIVLGVKTGRVLFSPYKEGATSILTAGQGLAYDIKKKEFLSQSSVNQDAWLTKSLVFVDTPLEEVCKQLTNYYGVVIKLQNDRRTAKKLNANFKDQSLNDVLVILNETYNIKIKKEHNQINLITPKQIN
ncbi:FecR domain-containing protein [Pedobacter sp. Du54]|uniref:FecR family protein n=1 Tax=Pedobacter anseongensis TaxID=3133439 RepID=UPI0030B1B084